MSFRPAAAILAGGRATRMGGQPKSWLVVNKRPIIERQLEVLRELFEEILIIANEPALYASLGLPVVPDAVPGVGPLGGILAALEAARADRVVVVACDMPYITRESLALLTAPFDEDAVVPYVSGRPEPLFARYLRSCAPAIRACLARGEHKVCAFHAHVWVRPVHGISLRMIDPSLRFLTNCNAPEDLLLD